MQNQKIKFVFFGTSEFSVEILESLRHSGLTPELVVATPDEPKGRGLALTPAPTKVWAHAHNIPTIEPESLKNDDVVNKLKSIDADLFIVASYGKIIPKNIFELPPHKTLNVHPSLLPDLRGAAPLQYTILERDFAAITIMLINEKMDEGAILYQEKVSLPEWPPKYRILESLLAKRSGELLADIIPKWLDGSIIPKEQDHSTATYTKKIEKKDSDITNDTPEVALRKIRAYEVWPRARKGDLIITDAHIENGELVIDRVIPPGKKEMDYRDYLRGQKRSNSI
jgi:methionyl-tRNA formyltransferase